MTKIRKAVGTLLAVGTLVLALSPPASAGTVYEVTHGWQVNSRKGLMMSPALRVRWSAGKNVTGIVDFDCWDGPGYASFKGCDTSHGKPGYPSMGIGVTWHYVIGFDPVGLVIKYYCDFRGSIWQNGGFNGTITCDYGSG